MSIKTLKGWEKSNTKTIEEYLKVGDKVDLDMYVHFLNILPPRIDYSNYLQVGGVCNHLPDKEGKLRPTFLTFSKDVDNDWIFNGECFYGEKINRNYLLIDIDKSILQHDEKFRYQLLGRMRSDCNYFLGNGNRLDKFLWAGNVESQIAYMKALYNSFPDNKKPEWISLEDINNYEDAMTNDEVNIDNNKDEPDICE